MSKYSENMPPSLKGAIEWLYDDIKPGSVLLDFGCATGYFGKFLKDNKNCAVYGLEISEDLEEARKNLDGVYSFDLDGEWPDSIYERKYDALFFGDVIEHLKDPAETLKKSKKLLKKGGKIFISTPNVAHLSIRLELLGGNFEYEKMGILDNTHLKYFTLNTLKKLAKEAGYSIDRVDSSTNDYPIEVTEKILKEYGLKPNETFWKLTKAYEARAYQYKLVISPNTIIRGSRNIHSPKVVQKPDQYRDDYISDLKSQIDGLKKHADKQAEIIEYLKNSQQQKITISKKIKNKITSSKNAK